MTGLGRWLFGWLVDPSGFAGGRILVRWLCALALVAAAALLLGIGLRAVLGGSAGVGFLLVLVAANVLVRLWWPRGGR